MRCGNTPLKPEAARFFLFAGVTQLADVSGSNPLSSGFNSQRLYHNVRSALPPLRRSSFSTTNPPVRGFVVGGANGYMVKLKLAYYSFWKFMRSIAHETLRKGYIDPRKTAALTTPLANHFYGWLKTLWANTENRDEIPREIVTLRRLFAASEDGRAFAEEIA